jgi:hypothetical protein
MGKYKLLSKGFFPEIVVQDFTIRGPKVFLHFRQRRWLNVEVIYLNFTLLEKGTRMTGDAWLLKRDQSIRLLMLLIISVLFIV